MNTEPNLHLSTGPKKVTKEKLPNKSFQNPLFRTGTQQTRLINYFARYKGTMLMASRACEIERASICRYVRVLEEEGILRRGGKRICAITGKRAFWFTVLP